MATRARTKCAGETESSAVRTEFALARTSYRSVNRTDETRYRGGQVRVRCARFVGLVCDARSSGRGLIYRVAARSIAF
jgi:hypothetical protein